MADEVIEYEYDHIVFDETPLPMAPVRRKLKYPFWLLQNVGQSILFEYGPNDDPTKLRHSIVCAMRRHQKKYGGEFELKTTTKGIRCWRRSKPE